MSVQGPNCRWFPENPYVLQLTTTARQFWLTFNKGTSMSSMKKVNAGSQSPEVDEKSREVNNQMNLPEVNDNDNVIDHPFSISIFQLQLRGVNKVLTDCLRSKSEVEKSTTTVNQRQKISKQVDNMYPARQSQLMQVEKCRQQQVFAKYGPNGAKSKKKKLAWPLLCIFTFEFYQAIS